MFHSPRSCLGFFFFKHPTIWSVSREGQRLERRKVLTGKPGRLGFGGNLMDPVVQSTERNAITPLKPSG